MFTCTAIFVVVYITCEVNREVLEAAAGGFNLALKDVHNAGKSWLATNKDIRLQGTKNRWQLQRD